MMPASQDNLRDQIELHQDHIVATEETVTNETGAGIALTRAENTRKHSVEEGFVSIKFKSREPVKNDSDGKAVVALNI